MNWCTIWGRSFGFSWWSFSFLEVLQFFVGYKTGVVHE